MKFLDTLTLSVNSLRHRGLRSWLTALGIVIGIAAVVALVSIGQGLQQSVQEQLSGLGANLISVSPGFQRAQGGFGFGGGFGGSSISANLTENDARIIKSTPGVLYVDGIVSGRGDVSYGSETASLSVQGVDTSVWKFMETTKLESGRYLSQGDTYAAVIGNNVANRLYKQPARINSQISIDGHNFRVVGILQSGGAIALSDSTVIIPRDIARKTLSLDMDQDQFSSIAVQTSDASDVQSVSSQIERNLLLTRHKTEDTKDFTILSSESLQQQIGTITQTITLFLGGIAAISLFVGGIGIANTMFMSVVERTRQIGVLKALGTTNSEVMKLFLTESGLLGLIGGIIGVLLGVVISNLISLLGSGFLTGQRPETVVTPELILFSIGFSIVIGAISGLLPARRAAKLQPVEALRYE